MKTSARALGIVLVTMLVLVGCEEDPPVEPGPADTGSPPSEDAGTGVDARDPSLPSCDYPQAGPYGSRVTAAFEPFVAETCAGDDWRFYSQEFCDSTFTVISIAAGWCNPCRYESSQLTAQVTEAYRDRGVRVIQVLVQDEDYMSADQAYCEAWVSMYGLTNTELLDPFNATGIDFPDGSLPSTIIVDRQGIIRFRENGATEGLVSLRAKLDMLLAELAEP
jgi:hypothetical protein